MQKLLRKFLKLIFGLIIVVVFSIMMLNLVLFSNYKYEENKRLENRSVNAEFKKNFK